MVGSTVEENADERQNDEPVISDRFDHLQGSGAQRDPPRRSISTVNGSNRDATPDLWKVSELIDLAR